MLCVPRVDARCARERWREARACCFSAALAGAMQSASARKRYAPARCTIVSPPRPRLFADTTLMSPRHFRTHARPLLFICRLPFDVAIDDVGATLDATIIAHCSPRHASSRRDIRLPLLCPRSPARYGYVTQPYAARCLRCCSFVDAMMKDYNAVVVIRHADAQTQTPRWRRSEKMRERDVAFEGVAREKAEV